MTSIRESIRRLFKPISPLPAGLYPYQAPPEAPLPFRLHLRLEADGSGTLIVNAATILHLNQTAAEYAYFLIKGYSEDGIAEQISNRYRVSIAQAQEDCHDFIGRLHTLVDTPDLDPESFLDFDRSQPYTSISAPYRLDCALTYQLPPGTDPTFAPTKRVARELTLAEWQDVLDKAWKAGVPQVVFTGGEPTLRADLPQLITHAEANGQISGLLTDGIRFAEAAYLEQILQTGLDHLLLVLDSRQEAAWKALENLVPADIFLTVHLTVTPENAGAASEIIARLAKLGVKNISLSATTADLQGKLSQLRDYSAELGLALVWDLPVPYSVHNPVALETLEDRLSPGAGRAWLYVEPDGDVLPSQGAAQMIGNILTDEWETIWQSAIKQPDTLAS